MSRTAPSTAAPAGDQPTSAAGKPPLTGKQLTARVAIVATVLGIIAMWIYAFVFASKDPAAGLEDDAWAARAQQLCEQRNERLADNVATFDTSDGSIGELHDAIKEVTDLVEQALNEVVAVKPSSASDQRLVDEWERLYRIYIADRRDAEAQLASGRLVELNETTLNGSPISATITDFTNPNKMSACAPPVGQ